MYASGNRTRAAPFLPVSDISWQALLTEAEQLNNTGAAWTTAALNFCDLFFIIGRDWH
jgi:hypothetical protein